MRFPSELRDLRMALAALAEAVAMMSSGLARQSPTAQKPSPDTAQTPRAAAGDGLEIYDLWVPRDATQTISYRDLLIEAMHHDSDFKTLQVESVIKP